MYKILIIINEGTKRGRIREQNKYVLLVLNEDVYIKMKYISLQLYYIIIGRHWIPNGQNAKRASNNI